MHPVHNRVDDCLTGTGLAAHDPGHMKKVGLTLVVPVYNEELGIEQTLDELRKIKKSAKFPLEILLVNDGSKDGTGAILAKVPSREFSVIEHPQNRGYGAALKTGIAHAAYDYIAITDADGTYPNERIPELYKMTIDEKLDMLVGSRTGKDVKIALIRRPPKFILRKLAEYLSARKIPDMNSGLRIMRREVLLRFMNILPDGFSFTTTITLAMTTNNYAVRYEPIDYFHRAGKSKIRPFYDTLNFLQLILRTTLYFNPLKIFLPISILLVFLGFAVLGAGWYFLGEIMDASFSLIQMTALIVLAIGLLGDLINKRLP